jgi:hypothetical protein
MERRKEKFQFKGKKGRVLEYVEKRKINIINYASAGLGGGGKHQATKVGMRA